MPLDSIRNPVHPRYFGDPFALRAGDTWFAYGTGPDGDALSARHGARVFEIRRSPDFATWVSAGYALLPPPLPAEAEGEREFRSPEVIEWDGRFRMFYSTGIGDLAHHLRVATAEAPEGPFEDAGVDLTPAERQSLDPHPFRDDDGAWYLYYARDVLEGSRPGREIAVDRLVAPDRLAGEPRVALAPNHDWQRGAPGSSPYGGSGSWHVLAGPCVRRRFGRYWCLYAAGGIGGTRPGVSVAVADDPLGPFVEPSSDGPSLLQGIPGLRDPGQCSVVEGPDGEDWIVYDAWDDGASARRMCIDRLTWTPEGPLTPGPTLDAQPVPQP